MIDASKSAFLVAAVVERSAAVRAMLSQKPYSSHTVAKGDKIFTQEVAHALARSPAQGSRQPARAGIQYRLINVPMGVPGPTLVMRSFSSRESISSPIVRTKRVGRTIAVQVVSAQVRND